jgi:gamma-glutamyltranspeptidase/glutathione hydrolase
MAEVTRFAFAERERRPLLPDDWTPELQAALLAGERDGETTHLCAADAEGGVVSLTQSIQSLFGAKVANPRYGFLYNNYLLTCPRRPHSYRLRGRGIARSNAVPSLVVDAGGAPVLALGAAGSRRIVSSVLQVVAAVVHRGERVDAALDAPRIHARLRGPAWVERDALTPEAEIELGRRGIPIEARPRHSFKMGAVQAIAFGRDGTLVGAADPRREGEPRGL